MSLVPTTYDEWEHCITVKCGIPLTLDYAEERIKALQDMNDYHTQKFVQQWGDAHRERTLAWFQEAKQRLTA